MKEMKRKYDVAVIGAGVSGCSAARELSRFRASVCVLEKESDVCEGTSKANSAVAHAGFDAEPGTLKARLNLEGSLLMEGMAKELDFPYRRNGSLVVCQGPEELPRLCELKERGARNGVEGLVILDRKELRKKEPNLADGVYAALYAPTGGIVCPFGMNIAFAENAAQNGVSFFFNTAVQEILPMEGGGFRLRTDRGDFQAACVVNAAGVYADVFHNMVSQKKLHITARRGEYLLFDKAAGTLTSSTVFQLPGPMGKGVLVTPTVHGNLLVGPTATDQPGKENAPTTASGMAQVRERSRASVKNLPMGLVITSFAGLRAHEDGGDFIIGEAEDAPGFVDVAGIESPGLTCAPAVGRMVAGIVRDILDLEEKTDFIATRKDLPHFAALSLEDQMALVRKNPAYGQIVCRCETVTEGEILDAIHRPVGARTLDGVKRRTRAGMGRCQAGFCTARVMEILSRELGVGMEGVRKNGPASRLVLGENKDAFLKG